MAFRSKHGRRGGHTLVEVLVAVALVVILMLGAMRFLAMGPVLRDARRLVALEEAYGILDHILLCASTSRIERVSGKGYYEQPLAPGWYRYDASNAVAQGVLYPTSEAERFQMLSAVGETMRMGYALYVASRDACLVSDGVADYYLQGDMITDAPMAFSTGVLTLELYDNWEECASTQHFASLNVVLPP